MEHNLSDYDALLVKLCEDHYLEGINVSELGNKYNMSRYKVIKCLEEAKEKQIVTIQITSPYSKHDELELFFKRHFQTNVHVMQDVANPSNQEAQFFQFVADHVQEQLAAANVVSLAWGDTMYRVIDKFKKRSQEDLIFTQFIGEFGKYNSLAGSLRLVQKAAETYHAKYVTLSAPVYIINDLTREALSLEPGLAETLNIAKSSDVLLTGIGTPASIEAVPIWNQYTKSLFPDLTNHAGFLYGRPYNDQGHFLMPEWDKTFGLNISDILGIPIRMGVCHSKFKAHACLGALKGNLLTHLFLDEKTAWKVMTLMTK